MSNRLLIFLVCFLYLITLFGCSQKTDVTSCMPLPSSNVSKIQKPLVIRPSHLSILGHKEIVHLGMSVEQTLKVFNKPEIVTKIKTLPIDLPNTLKAHGWYTKTEFLGVISQKDTTTLILYTQKNVSVNKIRSIFQSYIKVFEKPLMILSDRYTSYKFWEANGQRLMLCSSTDHMKKKHLTIALGEISVMDILRMNPKDAAHDQLQANKMLQKLSKENSTH